MPTYVYTCTQCNKDFEEFLSMKESDSVQTCPECHGPAEKQLTAGAKMSLDWSKWQRRR
jgi:putative FmdB family regulatory protein